VYKSQGRKTFETDVPARVPVSLVFHCPNLDAPNEPSETLSWHDVKALPDVTIHESVYNQTVVLLASTPNPRRNCISESLDLELYSKIYAE
jgi:hypothetical protein